MLKKSFQVYSTKRLTTYRIQYIRHSCNSSLTASYLILISVCGQNCLFLVKCQEAVSIFVQAEEDIASDTSEEAQALAVSMLTAASWSSLWQMVSAVLADI